MAQVLVQPAGLTLEVEPGETLAESAWRQGYRWPTICWGNAECMVCAVLVTGGEAATVPADAEEEEAMRLRLPRRLRRPEYRLACRLRFTGDGAVVEKKGVHPPPDTQTDPQGEEKT
ncbi:2Fe-2S iron-sulfur cluster binding domain-containing protein [Streptomyces sp. NPDC048251]|uniref:2Fe-2S iron-sulfur cluster-binding protein n=1 Tax=Streptomyces sp. NPDC048251 TaxID=3154501 RepID=UPI00342921BD